MSELPHFTHSLPMVLLRGREVVMSYFRPMLHEYGATEQQWRVIRAVHANNDIEITDLARRCLILSSSLTRILQSLEKRKLISRRVVRGDQRRYRIRLTQKGYRLFETISPIAEARYQALIENFGKTETDELYRLLKLLEERADLDAMREQSMASPKD